MKSFFLISFILTSLFTTIFAQETWEWQNPLPQGNNLYDVHVFEDNSAMAVGNTGTIINVNSFGQIEQIRNKVNGKVSKFNCLFFVNSDTGWIGGDGYILKTVDGGVSWKGTELDSIDFLWQYENIFFINDSIGWISGTAWGWGWGGGVILETSDGGENWRFTKEGLCNDLHFINADTGWSVIGEYGTSYSLHKTTDGGLSWNQISDESFNKIYFINDSIGWGAGYSGLMKTEDGGYNWQVVIESINCTEVYFTDVQHGWVLMYSDSIIYTEDGGNSWRGQNFDNPDIFEINTACFKPDGYGIAVGNGGHIRRKLPQSFDWRPITTTCFNGEIKGLQVINEDNIWTCGWIYEDYDYTTPLGNTRVLLNSTDGGDTWEKTLFEDSNNSQLNDIYFLNERIGWAVGQNNIIINTRDGGSTWEYQDSGFENNNLILEKVFFVDSLIGWIIGNPWSSITYLFSTKDGGETWDYIQNTIPSLVMGFDFCFVNKNDGWLVGHNDYDGAGEIYTTKDGGQTWQINKRKIESYSYKSVQFLDSLVGWVAGDNFNSEILFTENGGDDWQIIFTNPYPITDFIFVNQNYGWVIISNVGWTENQFIRGYHPTYLYFTNNGGQSWQEYGTIPTPYINKIDFANENTGWIVGPNGTILKTNNGGITAFADEPEETITNPRNFRLSQNYPNPFNNSTMINYQLPITSQVDLSIYNILGQKVVTLVSENQPVGTYKVQWDASGQSSGLYIYRLETDGGFVQSKKLLLIK